MTIQKLQKLSNNKGFTLVELVIVMAIFVVAIILGADSFDRIITLSKQQVKSSESNIQGVVGLEIVRVDLEQAGYGMPWLMGFVADFDESAVAADYLAAGINPADFNDINLNATALARDANKVPRAVQSKASTTDARDYLVLKSTLLGMSDTVKKWAYVDGVGAASTIKTWGDSDFVENERVVTLSSPDRRLIAASTTDFYYAMPSPQVPPTAYQPTQLTDIYLVYGVGGANLRAPYNRADYYIKRPADVSTRCAQGTGNLYKAVLNSAGGVTQYPLLECVADMQVVYALDTNADKQIDDYTNENGLEGYTAAEIRSMLKEIRIYLLVQEGQKDRTYTFPGTQVQVGEALPISGFRGRAFDFTARGVTDYQNYRWKVYTLVAAPRNIN